MTSPKVLAFGAGLAAALATPAAAQDAASGYWYRWGYGHMMFGGLAMIVVWGLLIVLVVLAVRWLGPDRGARSESENSRSNVFDILDERFARGEIDQKEYEERRKVLTEARKPTK